MQDKDNLNQVDLEQVIKQDFESMFQSAGLENMTCFHCGSEDWDFDETGKTTCCKR